MKVFITGATGYIGHQLTKSLSNQNHEISILVRDPLSERIPKTKNITIHKGDLCDYNSIYKAMNGCDYVFHAAAFTDLKCTTVNKFYDTNVVGTENILKSAINLNIKKLQLATKTISDLTKALPKESFVDQVVGGIGVIPELLGSIFKEGVDGVLEIASPEKLNEVKFG